MSTPPSGWLYPLKSYVISQRFGAQNGHDAGGHPGVDMAAPFGTPVLAPQSGVITYAGPASGFGNNYVSMNTDDGIEVDFGHMSAMYVRQGQHVNAGDIIGHVGSEGFSTGNHLHLQFKIGGRLIDPIAYLQGKGAVGADGNAISGGGGDGPVPSWIPGSGTINGLINAVNQIDQFIAKLLNPEFWLRAGKVGAGLVVVAIGIAALHRGLT